MGCCDGRLIRGVRQHSWPCARSTSFSPAQSAAVSVWRELGTVRAGIGPLAVRHVFRGDVLVSEGENGRLGRESNGSLTIQFRSSDGVRIPAGASIVVWGRRGALRDLR